MNILETTNPFFHECFIHRVLVQIEVKKNCDQCNYQAEAKSIIHTHDVKNCFDQCNYQAAAISIIHTHKESFHEIVAHD